MIITTNSLRKILILSYFISSVVSRKGGHSKHSSSRSKAKASDYPSLQSALTSSSNPQYYLLSKEELKQSCQVSTECHWISNLHDGCGDLTLAGYPHNYGVGEPCIGPDEDVALLLWLWEHIKLFIRSLTLFKILFGESARGLCCTPGFYERHVHQVGGKTPKSTSVRINGEGDVKARDPSPSHDISSSSSRLSSSSTTASGSGPSSSPTSSQTSSTSRLSSSSPRPQSQPSSSTTTPPVPRGSPRSHIQIQGYPDPITSVSSQGQILTPEPQMGPVYQRHPDDQKSETQPQEFPPYPDGNGLPPTPGSPNPNGGGGGRDRNWPRLRFRRLLRNDDTRPNGPRKKGENREKIKRMWIDDYTSSGSPTGYVIDSHQFNSKFKDQFDEDDSGGGRGSPSSPIGPNTNRDISTPSRFAILLTRKLLKAKDSLWGKRHRKSKSSSLESTSSRARGRDQGGWSRLWSEESLRSPIREAESNNDEDDDDPFLGDKGGSGMGYGQEGYRHPLPTTPPSTPRW